jgi:DNA helicase-2/ATP-dependent DNA helicase PcrA
MNPSPRKLADIFSTQLTASQKQAVFHRDGPLLVIAGPGSGKTRVITYRIAALIESGVAPYNICAITFTNKAAEEMRQRAVSLGASGGAYISTFHSLCVRILRRYASVAGVNPNFSIYDDSDQSKCVKQSIADCGFDSANFPPARMLDAISTLKNKLIDADSYQKQAYDFFSKALSKIYSRYQKILNELSALDFDDLLTNTAFLLEGHAEVCTELGNRFKYLLIDEYQDTNHAQYRIAKALASSHNNICATGDPDQSIYRWRGADIRNILDFERDWPDALVVRLEENFRSTPAILNAADRLIANNQSRKEKRLIATRPAEGKVLIEQFEDEQEEALGLAENINQLVSKGVSLSRIAVFYRVNAQSRAIEEQFIRNKIPYQIVRGVEFYNRKEIRDVLAYLKVIVNPADRVALLRIINTPTRGLGKTTIDKILDYASRSGKGMYDAIKEVKQVSNIPQSTAAKLIAFYNMMEDFKKDASGPVEKIIESVFEKSGLEKSLNAEGADGKDAIANIEELISAAAVFDKQAAEDRRTSLANAHETPPRKAGLRKTSQGFAEDTETTEINEENKTSVAEDGGQGAEDGGQGTEGGGRRTEDGRQRTEKPSLVDYLQQIALFSDADAYDASVDRAALMTLHSAKGLEFDNVFIVGVEEGLLPHERSAEGADETEEERRLFFVGITRAKTNLFISFARYRQIRGQTLRTIPSQFLYEIGIEFSESTPAAEDSEIFSHRGHRDHRDNEENQESESYLSSVAYKNSVAKGIFRRGDIVVHKKFGLGTVKDFADMGENSIVTVAFNTGTTKTLMLKYAKLTKI